MALVLSGRALGVRTVPKKLPRQDKKLTSHSPISGPISWQKQAHCRLAMRCSEYFAQHRGCGFVIRIPAARALCQW